MPDHDMSPRRLLLALLVGTAVVLVVVLAAAIVRGPWQVVLARDANLGPAAPSGALVLLEPLGAPADAAEDRTGDRFVRGTTGPNGFRVQPEGPPHRVRLVVPRVGSGLERLASPGPRNLVLGVSIALLVGSVVIGRRPVTRAG